MMCSAPVGACSRFRTPPAGTECPRAWRTRALFNATALLTLRRARLDWRHGRGSVTRGTVNGGPAQAPCATHLQVLLGPKYGGLTMEPPLSAPEQFSKDGL